MSPIDIHTIRVETWTDTRKGKFQAPGETRTQVLAQGDLKDPGSFVYVRGVLLRNINMIRSPELFADVPVDKKTGEILDDNAIRGLWRRYIER